MLKTKKSTTEILNTGIGHSSYIFLKRDRHHVVQQQLPRRRRRVEKMDFVANSTSRWAGNFEACQEHQGMSTDRPAQSPVETLYARRGHV